MATSTTPRASSRQSGEYTNVSAFANLLSRTRLKKPTYLNSPIARATNPRASAYDSHDSRRRGRPTETMPAVAMTRTANASKATPTEIVALRDGTNRGLPFTLGIARELPVSALKAMTKCQIAIATKAMDTSAATTVYMTPNG